MKGVSELGRPFVRRPRPFAARAQKISAEPAPLQQSSGKPPGADHSSAALALSLVAVLLSSVSLVLQNHEHGQHTSNSIQQKPSQFVEKQDVNGGHGGIQQDMYAPR